MTSDEINEYVRNCPYSDKSIDSIHSCELEFHYRKICPSSSCICAKRFGIAESEDKEMIYDEIKQLPSIVDSFLDVAILNEVRQHLNEKLDEVCQLAMKALDQRWIPVGERLPEEFICDDGYVEPSDYVLVWGDHGNYGVSRYWGNRRTKSESPNTYKDWMDLDWVVQKPIAWMPLPDPYKEEEA